MAQCETSKDLPVNKLRETRETIILRVQLLQPFDPWGI